MDIDTAAYTLVQAKAEESAATAKRIAAENALLALLPTPEKAEGTESTATQYFKIAVTYGMNRTLDAAALDAIRSTLAPHLFDTAITYKPAINLPGLRTLQAKEPSAYALLAQAITAKPAKPSVKVEATAAALAA